MKLSLSNVFTHVATEAPEEAPFVEMLKEFLKVRADGYRFNAAFKRGKWDGYMCLLKYSKFPTGLFPTVARFLEKQGAVLTLVDYRKNLPVFRAGLSVASLGLDLRDYQFDAILAGANTETGIAAAPEGLWFPRGIYDAATNAGKTHIMAGLHFALQDARTILLVHRQNIHKQLVDDFKRMIGDREVGQIAAGRRDVREFTVAMAPSLAAWLQDDPQARQICGESFNAVFVDEAHRSGAKEYLTCLAYIDAGARYHFSGSALKNESKVKNLQIIGSAGKPLYKIAKSDLFAKGISRRPQVHLHFMPEGAAGYAANYTQDYEDNVSCSAARLDKLIEIVTARTDKYILITFRERRHGRAILKALETRLPFLGCRYCDGETPGRDYIFADFAKGKFEVFVCSLIVQEGMNLPNIDVLVRSEAGESEITTLQVSGRGERAKEGSDTFELHDFWDTGKWTSQHARKRVAVYRKEGFGIEAHYEHTPAFAPVKALLEAAAHVR